MENSSSWPWFVVFMLLALVLEPARSDPQLNLIIKGCSQYKVSGSFFNSLNATFADLRKSLLNEKKHYATAQRSMSEEPVFVMVQCRNYLSTKDCVKCFDTAAVQIRNCSHANGARIIYDGCILRYESTKFYRQGTADGNSQQCGNRTAQDTVAFNTAVGSLVKDLELATPKTSNRYAATKTEIPGGGKNVYGVAQCSENVIEIDCQECLKVASRNIQGCFPTTDARAFDAGCFLRYSTTRFFADNQTVNIRPFLEHGSSSKRKVIIGAVAGGVGLLLVAFMLFLWYQLSRTAKATRTGNILEATQLQGPLRYSYKDLKNATKNFSEENKLGEGGFGEVYKGTLKNGNVVAVKKLIVSSSAAKAQFESEVKLISNVHHRNLIRLLGCSNKRADLLLVYEYMSNGSLDKFLYGEKKGTLNWKQRYEIIFGTARGLAYLHEQFHVRIIHRDIKSSNILLDDDFLPKIADFGLARLLPENQSHLSTRFAGTLGYTAPEYAIHGQLTEKVDTFSFGVVALEIISGRRSTDAKSEPVAQFLLEEAWKLVEKDMHLKLVDEALDPNQYTPEEVKKVIGIALSCTQSPAALRPTMSEVVVMLTSDSNLEQKTPTRPTFIDAGRVSSMDTSASTASSKATATFTAFSGR
ncbi:transmembrane signal receptor [Lithospermum erythrorhizon]|uniref:Transmembrane signal receptor n=1 Tax=Lithospermum erythrorhizon TaxID=34254 RepID=A0AAV3QLJ4_LITER